MKIFKVTFSDLEMYYNDYRKNKIEFIAHNSYEDLLNHTVIIYSMSNYEETGYFQKEIRYFQMSGFKVECIVPYCEGIKAGTILNS